MPDELVRIEKSGPLAVPDHIAALHGHEGLENVTREDLVLPRLMICQAMSPQRKKTNPNYIAALTDGDLFNSVTGEIYGSEVQLIPLLFSKSRLYFRDLASGGGILCQSFNGVDGGSLSPTCEACPNSKFDGLGKAPVCNLFYNFPSLILPSQELIAASFKSTGLKAGKNWLSRMALLKKPAYAGVYQLRVVEQANQKGTFFAPVVSFKRWTTFEELQLAQSQFAALRGKTIRTDDAVEEEQDENVPF